MATKRIAVLTGSRSEYDLLRSLLRAINEHPDLTLQLFVTGCHLGPSFGDLLSDVEADGFEVRRRIPLAIEAGNAVEEACYVTDAMAKIACNLAIDEPDMLLIYGHSPVALAGAAAAVMCRVVLVHYSPLNTDGRWLQEKLRPAIVGLADMHITPSKALAAVYEMRRQGAPIHCGDLSKPDAGKEIAEILADA